MPGVFVAGSGTSTFDPPVPKIWTLTEMSWTVPAYSEKVWDLTDKVGGVVILDQGLRGLNMPPVTKYKRDSPALAGSRVRGKKTNTRTAFWPLMTVSEISTEDWMLKDVDFWNSLIATLQPGVMGIWSVTPPNRETRTLQLSLADDGDTAYGADPGKWGYKEYEVTLDADNPYWCGPVVTKVFNSETDVNFYGGGDPDINGYGPPFYLMSRTNASTANISNPGDVAAYPTWTINGPTTTVTIGVGGRNIEVPFAVASDTSLTIRTDPEGQTAITNLGVDRTAELGTVDWSTVPSGQSVPLLVEIAGSGSVQVELEPRYYRAFSNAVVVPNE